ncbi:unnamed protein product [Closterium sp. Naga37s-1]|nr:unnamed protein product [Closterium sp. Naga37s-1]
MAIGQQVCLSPDLTVEQAKLRASTIINVASSKAEQFGEAPGVESATDVPRPSFSLTPSIPAATPTAFTTRFDPIKPSTKEDERHKPKRGTPTGSGGAELKSRSSDAGISNDKEEEEEGAAKDARVLELLKLEEQLKAKNAWGGTRQRGGLGQSTRENGGAAGLVEGQGQEEEDYAVSCASLLMSFQKLGERATAFAMQQRAARAGVQIDRGGLGQSDEANRGAAEKRGAEGNPELLQMPFQANMVHFLDVMSAIVDELGASRNREFDNFASMLVQVLGVKESADLQKGCGFFVQHLLSGVLEKAHAEGRGGAGGKAAEKVHGEGKGMGGG